MRKIDHRLLTRFDRYLVGQRRLADSTRRLRHQRPGHLPPVG